MSAAAELYAGAVELCRGVLKHDPRNHDALRMCARAALQCGSICVRRDETKYREWIDEVREEERNFCLSLSLSDIPPSLLMLVLITSIGNVALCEPHQ